MIHTAVRKEEDCLAFCTGMITDIGCSVTQIKLMAVTSGKWYRRVNSYHLIFNTLCPNYYMSDLVRVNNLSVSTSLPSHALSHMRLRDCYINHLHIFTKIAELKAASEKGFKVLASPTFSSHCTDTFWKPSHRHNKCLHKAWYLQSVSPA